MKIDEAKEALRVAVRARRTPVLEAASRAMQERLLGSEVLAGARCVALYRALPSEPGTGILLEALPKGGVRVCLPVVEGDQRALRFVEIAGGGLAGAALQKSKLGIEEPATGANVPLDQIDVFVVPGLAADLQGHRLGRGRGHYDATLAAAPQALRVMLVLESSLVDGVPVGAHDQRLDALCTEERLILCPPRI